jgi:predicted nicotinamide N-methyase
LRSVLADMPLRPVPFVPEISLHLAHPGSGLRRLAEARDDADPPPPYWAWVWGGGAALARYVLDNPARVAGRRVLDLGAGSGVVGIAAAKAGARAVFASEVDPDGRAVLALNAAANGVAFAAIVGDLTAGSPPAIDLVLVGDLFYAPDVAARTTAFLDRCLAAGMEALVGDPHRAWLPRERLRQLAGYAAPDFGDAARATPTDCAVFAFEAR